ncbi:hypothetical protein [Streptomyces collinus]
MATGTSRLGEESHAFAGSRSLWASRLTGAVHAAVHGAAASRGEVAGRS